MDIHPIKTKDDHEQALLRIDSLMNAEPDTDEGAELDVLVTLVETFENEAAKMALRQDASDIEAFEVREKEPDCAFEDVVKDLKRRGKI